jgi:hypothetical protein
MALSERSGRPRVRPRCLWLVACFCAERSRRHRRGGGTTPIFPPSTRSSAGNPKQPQGCFGSPVSEANGETTRYEMGCHLSKVHLSRCGRGSPRPHTSCSNHEPGRFLVTTPQYLCGHEGHRTNHNIANRAIVINKTGVTGLSQILRPVRPRDSPIFSVFRPYSVAQPRWRSWG